MAANRYSLKRKQEMIEIEESEGVVKMYALRELSGKERDAFLNHMASRVKIVNGQPVGMKDVSGIQSRLLSRCIYSVDDVLVTQEEIDLWPADMQTELFIKAQKMSGLAVTESDKKDMENEAKND